MRNDTKRKVGTLILVASLVFFGHWIDFFQMIKPGTYTPLMNSLNTEQKWVMLNHWNQNLWKVGHENQPIAKDSVSPEVAVMHGEQSPKEHGTKIATDTIKEEAALSSHASKEETNGGHESMAEHESESSFVSGFTLPGLLDIGVLVGFLAGFLLFVFNEIGKAPLQPKKDPYLRREACIIMYNNKN
jgi:hypothetical protein